MIMMNIVGSHKEKQTQQKTHSVMKNKKLKTIVIMSFSNKMKLKQVMNLVLVSLGWEQ
jgi:hypothetical protein